MSYVGVVEKKNNASVSEKHRVREKSKNTKSWLLDHAGVFLKEDEGRAKVEKRDGVICAVDGQIFSAKKNGRPDQHDDRTRKVSFVLDEWLRCGETFLADIDATASISLWDSTSNRLVLARASDGIPPLFFAEKEGKLLWSDRISLLLEHGINAELDPYALDAYFTLGYVPSPWTLFAEIRKVPAGQYLGWSSSGGSTLKQHREPVPRTQSVGDIEIRTTQFKERLCEGLDRLTQGHDRVGVLLSGGVDSALLVGLLHSELGTEVEAFTFEYSGHDGRYNEYSQARRLTDRYGIPHRRIRYTGRWLASNVEEAVENYEGPFTYGLHTAQLKEVAESGVSLLLNGVKGSVHISRTADYALRLRGAFAGRIARAGKTLLDALPSHTMPRFRHGLDVAESPASDLFYRMPVDRMIPDSVRGQLYANPERASSGKDALMSLFAEEVRRSGLRRKADQLSHLHNHFSVSDHFLWWNYRWTQVQGLEMGAPFLMPAPRRLMESLRQPLWPPHEESIRKVLIRRAAATVMPDEIAYSEKVAQTAPLWSWFRGPLYPLLRKYLQPSELQKDGLFNADFVEHEVERHTAGTGDRPYVVWSLLCFMIWKRNFLEE
jgi:asparagine synthase (glutamine-hydrolysing)